MDHAAVSVIVPINDLESETIARWTRAAGIHTVALNLPWGHSVTVADLDLQRLKPTVLLVELPSPELEDQLRRRGHVVCVCDHHFYPGATLPGMDRRHPLSALEQVVRLLHLPISPAQQLECALIGANDRGFIPALARILRARLNIPPPPAIDGQPAPPDPRPTKVTAALGPIWYWRLQDLARILPSNRGTTGGQADASHRGPLGDPIDPGRLTEPTTGQLQAVEAELRATVAQVERLHAEGHLIELGTRRGDADHPSLILVKAPDTLRFTLFDAIYRWKIDALLRASPDLTPAQALDAVSRPLDILAVLHDSNDRPTRVEFSGGRAWSDTITALTADLTTPSAETARLTLWCGGSDSVFMGAVGEGESDPPLLEAVADRLLNNLLIGNRPVEAWRTHFFQAMEIPGLNRAELKWPVERASLVPLSDQERFYFLPFLQDTILPRPLDEKQAREVVCSDNRLASIDLTSGTLSCLSVTYDQPGVPPIVVPISGLRLHLFFRKAAILEWIVGEDWTLAAGKDPDGKDRFWRRLLASRYGPDTPTLARVLDFNASARMTFSTFKTGYAPDRFRIAMVPPPDSGKVPVADEVLAQGFDVSSHQVTGWLLGLLRRVLPPLGICPQAALDKPFDKGPVELLWDERARVLSAVAAAGDPPTVAAARARMDVVMARLQTVDRFQTYHVSDPAFAMRELQGGLYDRFVSMGSVYAATSHSFVFLGYGGFPRAHILPHMGTIYRRMFLLILFYSAVLSRFAQNLAGTDFTRENKAFADLRRAYLDFTNRLWFRQVSSQVQGIELFDLMWKQGWIDREYAQIAQEIGQSDEFSRLEAEERTSDFTRLVAMIGLPTLVAAVMDQWGNILGRDLGWVWFVLTLVLMGIASVLGLLIAAFIRDRASDLRDGGVRDAVRGFVRWTRKTWWPGRLGRGAGKPPPG